MTTAECSVAVCDLPVRTRGYCHAHYRSWMKYQVEPTGRVNQWNKNHKDEWIQSVIDDPIGVGCRDWPWATASGSVLRGKKPAAIVLTKVSGPRPKGKAIRHSCNRSVCCAPWHLSWG